MTLGAIAPKQIQKHLLFEAFLRELHGWLCNVPGVEYEGTPHEIVEEVVRNTDRFADYDDEALNHLRQCMVMAIRHKGSQLGLMVEKVNLLSKKPLIRVWVVA